MKKKLLKTNAIKPESVSEHIEEEYKKSKGFRKGYDEEILMLNIAYKIAQLRKTRHITQGELAKKIGTTQQTISRLEDSKNTQVTLQTLARVALALKAKLMIELTPQE
jgi:DNA-binding Xre family transcriptional regulator